MPEDQSENLET